MRAKLPWVLLAISLAINLGFAAAVFQSRSEAERLTASPGARLQVITDELGLSEQQAAGLLALRDRLRAGWKPLSDARRERRLAILTELAEPEIDRARLAQLMQEGGEEQRTIFARMAADLHGYLQSLTPEQRRRFLEMARERGFLRHLFGSWRRRN